MRLRRLERNRESARQSRQRKKQYLELLEGRVTALQQQIYELRSAHAAASHQTLEEQRRRLLLALEPVAYKDTPTPEDTASLIDAAGQLVDRFGPDCAERRAIRDFHFDQLQRLLLPPHTKFLLWLIHQPADFFVVVGEKPKEAKGKEGAGAGAGAGGKKGGADEDGAGAGANRPPNLWTLLCSEIGLASDQADKLRLQLRRVLGGPEMPKETWRLGVAATYLQRLRGAVSAAAAKAQSHLERVKEILTPAQLVRYLAWMERNKERVSMAIEQTVIPPAPSSGGQGAGAGAGNMGGMGARPVGMAM